MSIAQQPERTKADLELNATPAEAPPLAHAPVRAAVAEFRRGFYTDSRLGLLLALGEDGKAYRQAMEALLDDLRPRAGLETQLVEQIAETLWRMKRAQRMQDGMALKRIETWLEIERAEAEEKLDQLREFMDPIRSMAAALKRGREGPRAEEIEQFAKVCKVSRSEAMGEFMALLHQLQPVTEERERKALLKKARAQFEIAREPFEALAWKYSRRLEKVDSPEHIAALMVPDDRRAATVQRMEDAALRRLWRLTNTLAKVRQGVFREKKMLKKADQSRNVYENKENMDTLSCESSDI